ncbi:MAG: type II toxin-antitoxin system ParD family antitoxin [Acidobacteria bacterium]|nr:type II toxin-antitoxin system ParD family antitoxin [Acidobacteriota bacterium]
MEVTLTPEHERMIEEQVTAGRFSSPDEAIAAALELLQHRNELTLEEERKLVQIALEQLNRGEGVTIETPGEMDAFFEQIKERSGRKREGVEAE